MRKLHVNRHMIAANRKDGRSRPVYTLKDRGSTVYGHGIEIIGGTVTFVDPRNSSTLSCGAVAYAVISDDAEIIVKDPMSFSEVKSSFA